MARLTDDFEIVIERPKRGSGDPTSKLMNLFKKRVKGNAELQSALATEGERKARAMKRTRDIDNWAKKLRGGHCGCPGLDRDETIKMIAKKCKCSRKNAEMIDQVLTPRVIQGGNWWGDVGNWFKNAGKTIKKGVQDAGKWIEKKALPAIKNTAISAVGSIPLVGAYAEEGLRALDEHRKYDGKKASKAAVKSVPFVGEIAKQAWDDAEAGRKFQLGKAIKNQALTSVVDFVPGGRVGKAAAKVVAEKVREKTGGSIHRVIRHRDGSRTLIGGSGKVKLTKREAKTLTEGGASTRSQRMRDNREEDEEMIRPVRQARPPRPDRRCGAMSARGALIRKVMRENPGMTLGQASHFIKENDLF